MFKLLFRAGFAAMIVSSAYGLVLNHGNAEAMRTNYARVTKQTNTPRAWTDFCVRYISECDVPALPAADVVQSPATLRLLTKINHFVNTDIQPMSDQDHWGVADRWDIPTDGYGDCEDYALLKRKMLIEEGLPRQALLMTIVRDQHNEGHAILTVKTDQGDLILDNLNDAVISWRDAPYRFIKRQSQENPNKWVALEGETDQEFDVSR
jgi:predicted transglutaminase-like cysteine proteinase